MHRIKMEISQDLTRQNGAFFANPKPTLLPRTFFPGGGGMVVTRPGQGPWHMRYKVVPQFRIAKLVNIFFSMSNC